MRVFLYLFFLISVSNIAFSMETCVKNKEGIFCGEIISKDSSKIKRECINFKDKKVCGFGCVKNMFGADCKQDPDAKCIQNIHGVICGHRCEEHTLISACASKSYYNCIRFVDKAKCGLNCRMKFGDIFCDEEDVNAKYLK